jgi:hypothetical protein
MMPANQPTPFYFSRTASMKTSGLQLKRSVASFLLCLLFVFQATSDSAQAQAPIGAIQPGETGQALLISSPQS